MLMKRSLKELMQPIFKGNMLIIELSDFGYKNYFVECAYHFDKLNSKYSLSMWHPYGGLPAGGHKAL